LDAFANEIIVCSMEKQIKKQAEQIESMTQEFIGLKATCQNVQVQGQMAPAKVANDVLCHEEAYMKVVDPTRSLQDRIKQRAAALTMATEVSPEVPPIEIRCRRAMKRHIKVQAAQIKTLEKDVAMLKKQLQKAQPTNLEMGQSKSTQVNGSVIASELRAKLFNITDDYSVRARTRSKEFKNADDYFKCQTRLIGA
jgi:hypothetical protein